MAESGFHSHSFSREAYPEFLRFAADSAAARLPDPSDIMASDVVWRLPGSAPKENIRIWNDGSGVLGFVWFEPPTGMSLELRSGVDFGHPAIQDMLGWAETRRRLFPQSRPRFIDLDNMTAWAREIENPAPPSGDAGLCLTTTAFEHDAHRINWLERQGFRSTRHFAPHYRRDLQRPIPPADLTYGMSLHGVSEPELDKRVEVHRQSWLGSSWDLHKYLNVRSAPIYDEELDVVLELSDGTFVSYCLCWFEPGAHMGSYEPVGTLPEWRGRGVGKTVICEGLRRLKNKGAACARVSTAGFNEPAQALYLSCGFEPIGVCRTYMKVLSA